MAEKKYYWIKLDKDFFQSKQIKKLRRIAGGDTYTLIYLKLLLKSMNTAGKLYYEGIEDTFAEEIALDIDEDPDNVEVTIKFLIASKLMTEGATEATLIKAVDMVGCETGAAKRMRDYRARQDKALEASKEDESVTLLHDRYTEKEIERDKETDRETDKTISKSIIAQSSGEPSQNPPEKINKSESPVMVFPTNKKTEPYYFYQRDIDEFKDIYPAVDVMYQLKRMRAWLTDHPKNRKTAKGVMKFVHGWLAREQDKNSFKKPSPGDVVARAAQKYGTNDNIVDENPSDGLPFQ